MSDIYASYERDIQSWIENVTKTPFSGSFADHLRNGVVLCNLVNALRPNTILTINKYNAAFRQMQNVDNFLKVLEKLGISEADRFKTEDLFYENNIPKVVLTLALFAIAARDKFNSANNVDASGIEDLRAHALGTQKDGKVRVVDTGLSLFETGMKKAQTEASNVNRTNDRLVRKDMQEHAASGELGFIESDMVIKQTMITSAKRSGQDLIIRSKDVAVVSGELGFAEADRQSKQAMISDAKGRHMDNIIRSKDVAVVSGELGFAEADRQSKQAMISDARGRHMDNIIRTKDEAAVSNDLGFIDQHAVDKQRLFSDANQRMDHIIKQGDVSDDISYDD
jgi:hypothetical protein